MYKLAVRNCIWYMRLVIEVLTSQYFSEYQSEILGKLQLELLVMQ